MTEAIERGIAACDAGLAKVLEMEAQLEQVECAEGRAAVMLDHLDTAMQDFIADLTAIGDARFLELARCSFEQSFRLLRLAVFP